MQIDLPAGRKALVERVPDERVGEAEAQRHSVRSGDHALAHGFVEQFE